MATHTAVRFRLSLTLACAFMLMVALTVGTFQVLAGLAATRSTSQVATSLSTEVAGRVRDKVASLFEQATSLAEVLSMSRGLPESIDSLEQSLPLFEMFGRILDYRSNFYSIYLGCGDGSFSQVIAVRGDPSIVAALGAHPQTWFAQRAIYGKGPERKQVWRFIDASGEPLSISIKPAPEYDPRTRDWFKLASGSAGPVLSQVYIFNSSKQPGLTASAKLGSGAVMGVDVSISELNSFLTQNAPGRSQVFLLSSDNKVIAASQPRGTEATQAPSLLQPLSAIDGKLADLVDRNARTLHGDSLFWEGQEPDLRMVWMSDLKISDNLPVTSLVVAPADDFEVGYRSLRNWVLIAMVAVWILVLPISVFVAQRMVRPIRKMTDLAIRVGQMDFADHGAIRTRIREFDTLAHSFDAMRSMVAERTTELQRTGSELERLIEVGIALSAERDTERLMQSILSGARKLSQADGGTLYLRTRNDTLQFRMVQTESLGVSLGGPKEPRPNYPEVPLYRDGEPNHRNVASHAILEEETVVIDDAYHDTRFDFSGTRRFDEANKYRSVSFLTVPLKPRGGKILGALQLLNACDAGGNIVPFSPQIIGFVEALAAQAATALYNRELIDTHDQLLNDMIGILAGAIDTKSPYTGGHCRRVPELALMLADEVQSSGIPAFADFSFQTEAERREFRIAAWLHDIGKVTTPEYVVDKATKLETIYNRIHEIRARFEIVLRDAKIASLESRLTGASEAEVEAAYRVAYEQLVDDFRFLAECNLGAEFMAPERLARLEKIAAKTWFRHFDDRLGLSQEEMKRLEEVPPQSLPVEEKLLADKPEHLVRRAGDGYGAEQGFAMKVPVQLYNRGELHNMRISRGTLNDEERYKINEHSVQTAIMLEGMVWPDNLARVPRWASTHHEALNGQGYPRGLKADSLDVGDRILAMSDIFEALTASDRPYKKAKTLSEAIAILADFRDKGHIDGDLFALFLKSGLYRKYAQQFLPETQVDEVDIDRWLKKPS